METFLKLEKTGEQDLAPVALRQKKKPKCSPENDKNQKDIQRYFGATPRQATKKPETKKGNSKNVWLFETLLIEFWTPVSYLCFFLLVFLKRI